MLKKINIYETAITVSLDNEEASVVRENSMALLTNLCSHMVSKQNVIIFLYTTNTFCNSFGFRMKIALTKFELYLIYWKIMIFINNLKAFCRICI